MFFNYKKVSNDVYGIYIFYEFYCCFAALCFSFEIKWLRFFYTFVNLVIYESIVTKLETGTTVIPDYISTIVFVYSVIILIRDNWLDIYSIISILIKLYRDNFYVKI